MLVSQGEILNAFLTLAQYFPTAKCVPVYIHTPILALHYMTHLMLVLSTDFTLNIINSYNVIAL